MLEDLRRRFAFKATARSFDIIEDSVPFYHLLCLQQIFKEISVKAFISKLAVEALQIPVLPRTAFFGKFMAYAIFLNKLLESQTPELSVLISSDNSGHSMHIETFFQDKNQSLSGDIDLNINTQGKPAKEVFYGHTFYKPAVTKGIKDKIYSPYMIDIQRLCQRRFSYWQLSVFSGSLSLQIKASINTINLFMIYRNTRFAYRLMYSSLAIEGMAKDNLLHQRRQCIVIISIIRAIIQSAEGDFHEAASPFCFDSKLNHLLRYHSPFVDDQKFFLTISLNIESGRL